MKGVVGRNSQLRSRRRWWAWTSGPCGNPYTGDLQIPPEKKKKTTSVSKHPRNQETTPSKRATKSQNPNHKNTPQKEPATTQHPRTSSLLADVGVEPGARGGSSGGHGERRRRRRRLRREARRGKMGEGDLIWGWSGVERGESWYLSAGGRPRSALAGLSARLRRRMGFSWPFFLGRKKMPKMI